MATAEVRNESHADVANLIDWSNHHALCDFPVDLKRMVSLAECLGLGPLEYVGPLAESRLWGNPRRWRPQFESLEYSHLVVVRNGDYFAVFVSDPEYVNGSGWFRWVASIGGLLVLACSFDTTIYHEPTHGELIARAENGEVKLVEKYRDIPAKTSDRPNYSLLDEVELWEAMPALHAMIQHDVRISDDEGPIRFYTAFANECLTDVTHYCFRNPPPPPVWVQRLKQIAFITAMIIVSIFGAILIDAIVRTIRFGFKAAVDWLF